MHGGISQIEPSAELFRVLGERLPGVPVVGVLGNHDWYADGRRMWTVLERVGVKMLDNGRIFLDATTRRLVDWREGRRGTRCVWRESANSRRFSGSRGVRLWEYRAICRARSCAQPGYCGVAGGEGDAWAESGSDVVWSHARRAGAAAVDEAVVCAEQVWGEV